MPSAKPIGTTPPPPPPPPPPSGPMLPPLPPGGLLSLRTDPASRESWGGGEMGEEGSPPPFLPLLAGLGGGQSGRQEEDGR